VKLSNDPDQICSCLSAQECSDDCAEDVGCDCGCEQCGENYNCFSDGDVCRDPEWKQNAFPSGWLGMDPYGGSIWAANTIIWEEFRVYELPPNSNSYTVQKYRKLGYINGGHSPDVAIDQPTANSYMELGSIRIPPLPNPHVTDTRDANNESVSILFDSTEADHITVNVTELVDWFDPSIAGSRTNVGTFNTSVSHTAGETGEE
jgi:hypothetical protein